MPASPRRSARTRVPTAFAMHEPMPTADMSREEQAAVAEQRHVFRLKRKLPAFDEQHYYHLDRLAKIARTAATTPRVEAEEAAEEAAEAADLEPLEEPLEGPDAGLQVEPEDGHSSDEDEPPAPPPPPPSPLPPAAPPAAAVPAAAGPRVAYFPAWIEALGDLAATMQPGDWDIVNDSVGVSHGILSEEGFKALMNDLHTGEAGQLYGSNDRRRGQPAADGKTTGQYVQAYRMLLRSPLPPTTLRELLAWRASYNGWSQKRLAVEVVIPALYPQYFQAVKDNGYVLTDKTKVVKRMTSWLSGIGQGNDKPSKLSMLLEAAA